MPAPIWHPGGVAGTIEGTVASLGLLYTTLAHGADRIMIPNNIVLAAAVVPLREPDGVDLRARLEADIRPSDVERLPVGVDSHGRCGPRQGE